jgi:hypothetical protein
MNDMLIWKERIPMTTHRRFGQKERCRGPFALSKKPDLTI